MAESARRAAEEGLARCQALLPGEREPIALPVRYPSR
jgi:hypothetical protein